MPIMILSKLLHWIYGLVVSNYLSLRMLFGENGSLVLVVDIC